MNAQFSIAVHVCVALAHLRAQGVEPVSSELLARSVNTNPAYLRRVLSRLVKSRLLESRPGREGGVRLAVEPERITLDRVYQAMREEPFLPIHSQQPNAVCPVSCRMKDLMAGVSHAAEEAAQGALRKTTVAALVAAV